MRTRTRRASKPDRATTCTPAHSATGAIGAPALVQRSARDRVGVVPPRQRRAGYRAGHQLAPELEAAIDAEAARLAAIEDPLEAVQAVTEVFNALDDALEAVAEPRLRAVVALYGQMSSYDRIAQATGLSKSRVAQLYREARRRGM